MAKDNKNFNLGPKGARPRKLDDYNKGMVYHVAPSDRIDAIKKEGITPQPKDKRMWDTAFRHYEAGEDDPHVHAFISPKRAFEHADNQASRTKSPQTVLAVKVPVKGETIEGGWHRDPTPYSRDMHMIRKKGSIDPKDIVDEHPVKPAK